MEQRKKNPSKLSTFLRSRRAKHGGIALLLTVLFIAAAILLNLVANLLTDRFPALSVDLTQSSVYEVQPETLDYVRGLQQDVTVYVLRDEASFEAGGDYYVQASKLLQDLDRSADRVTVQFVDLTKHPTFTTPYTDVDWTSTHLMLVVSGDDYRVLDSEDLFDYDQEYLYYYGSYVVESQHVEQAVVTAILNVTTEEKVTVTVLSGQGEGDCSDFTALLANNAYTIEQVSLLSGEISADSRFVILYDPLNDIDDDVYTTLSDWLYNDGNYGHTLVYLPNDQKELSAYENLNTLCSEWGIELDSGYIYETDPAHMTNSMQPHLMSIFDYAGEDYTAGMRDTSVPVVMFYTMPIGISDDQKATPLLTSSDSAVILPNDADENWDETEEEPGTLNGAVIATQSGDTGDSSHLIVIGSYDALSSSALSASAFNNAAYFVNLFNTIAARDEIGITIEGKDLDSSELGATSAASISVLGVIVRYIIPLLIVLAGVVVWIRRRHL